MTHPAAPAPSLARHRESQSFSQIQDILPVRVSVCEPAQVRQVVGHATRPDWSGRIQGGESQGDSFGGIVSCHGELR